MAHRKHNDNTDVTNLITQIADPIINNDNDTSINKETENPAVLLVEPFYGGSHKQLMDIFINSIPHTFIGLPPKKWPWRARCSSLILSDLIPPPTTEKALFCSSVLSLAELLGLRPDLNKLKKIVYFHENQFTYPIREIKARDIQFAYNQITTCLAADELIFNSKYNMDSLLNNLNKIIKLLPDYRPKNLLEKIQPKCKVLYFPISFPVMHRNNSARGDELILVWPHRWEFDKDPDTILYALFELKKNRCQFKVHILGEIFDDIPDIFSRAKTELNGDILTFGYVQSKKTYFDILKNSHVAISTAKHEFFGVSMLEATFCGCFPLAPNALVYPEIYPAQCLYKDKEDLIKKLTVYCNNPQKAIEDRLTVNMDFEKYSVNILLPHYLNVFK